VASSRLVPAPVLNTVPFLSATSFIQPVPFRGLSLKQRGGWVWNDPAREVILLRQERKRVSAGGVQESWTIDRLRGKTSSLLLAFHVTYSLFIYNPVRVAIGDHYEQEAELKPLPTERTRCRLCQLTSYHMVLPYDTCATLFVSRSGLDDDTRPVNPATKSGYGGASTVCAPKTPGPNQGGLTGPSGGNAANDVTGVSINRLDAPIDTPLIDSLLYPFRTYLWQPTDTWDLIRYHGQRCQRCPPLPSLNINCSG